MPRVYNKYHRNAPPDVVNCMRPGPFGNQFVIGPDGDRDMVCDKHEAWTEANPEFKARVKRELRGKDLLCCCAPKRCHCDYLLKVANED